MKVTEARTLEDVKLICKEYGITNSTEYRARYKKINGLPAHPERVFKDQWISYRHFFDSLSFYSYNEALEIIRPKKLRSATEYKKFIIESQDKQLPYSPDEVYKDSWVSWYVFLGKVRPLTPENIDDEYIKWRAAIIEFLELTKGGVSKKPHLCRFVRLYIEKHEKIKCPIEFVQVNRHNLQALRQELESLSEQHQRKLLRVTREFFDYIIDEYLTLEDDGSGNESLSILEAKNPLDYLKFNDLSQSNMASESTKACLQYHFVRKLQDWIIPPKAKDFSDLRHLQQYSADWFEVDKSKIDIRDPDCVFKTIDGKYFLWSPISWIHTYALTKVPLRGRQLAYNDSGEGDDYIADIDCCGQLAWKKNKGPLRGTTKRQGFITKLPDEKLGLYTTTNKTKTNQGGYTIPWLPEDLGKWLVRLRKWQQKYNPIDSPTLWVDCKRTNYNIAQRKHLGKNCFLFREFGGEEPAEVSTALVHRVAAGLYNIQPEELPLAELLGPKETLVNYKSRFTPHSLRVSLITAYVVDFGMPIEMVMKIVGHSSILMSIYYVKIKGEDIREKLEEVDKRALKEKADALQRQVEEGKLESLDNQLIASSPEVLASIMSNTPRGNFIFRDYGICPFAASRCEDGGQLIGRTQARSPVPNGYLGFQNCLRCRHFITGPAFIAGLQALSNEVSFHANEQSNHYKKLQGELADQEAKQVELDRESYIASKTGKDFNRTEIYKVERRLRKLESEVERSAMKLDMYLTDLQSAYKLIKQSLACVSEGDFEKDSLKLIKQPDAELKIELEEVSAFLQLHEVCENAQIFESSSAEGAVAPRSQLLDKMADFNGLQLKLYQYSIDEQLNLGTQVVNLLKSRLGGMENVDRLVKREISFRDIFKDSGKLISSELELVMQGTEMPRLKEVD
ncbi:integrase-like protein [Idiomarina loihiensis]|uniref:gamma-mobile-trio integrase GmtZ n=1 Tax=Idiomarina TaxID=135575 RepID=UPI000D70EED9|nr:MULTISPECIES: VPA1269 family protein [Idiomarina]PWW40557.1 integrase-like protein [Idiomarina loihiensis]TDP50248.1 integrase-like protein [Idiomarina loihiensis]TDS24400.1 integrase-like protein [Idiomarina sp. H2]